MKKSDLIVAVKERASLPRLKDSAAAVTAVLECLEEAIESGEIVVLHGLGTFERLEGDVKFTLSPKLRMRAFDA